MKTELIDLIPKILSHDARYTKEAYIFVQNAVDFSINFHDSELAKNSHLSVQQLTEGIRLFANEQFGVMCQYTLAEWGISTTMDFGHIVFNLIEFDILSGQPDDRLEDFADLFDFDEAFRSPFADHLTAIDPARIPKVDRL